MRKIIVLAFVLSLFSLPAFCQTAVTLAWDANTETTLAGYKVYWGTASRVYGAPTTLGKVTTYKVLNLPCGQQLFFAVTAYDTTTPTPQESGYSNEVSAKLLCAPVNLRITSTSVASITKKEATILASTNIPASMTIVYQGVEGTFAQTVSSTPLLQHQTKLTRLRPHSTYQYTLTAYDDIGATDIAQGSFTTQ